MILVNIRHDRISSLMPQSHCFESRVSLQFEHLLKHLLKVSKLISHMHYVGETFTSFKRQYTRPQEKKKKLLAKTEDARINVLASISRVGHIKATKKYSLMFLALTF